MPFARRGVRRYRRLPRFLSHEVSPTSLQKLKEKFQWSKKGGSEPPKRTIPGRQPCIHRGNVDPEPCTAQQSLRNGGSGGITGKSSVIPYGKSCRPSSRHPQRTYVSGLPDCRVDKLYSCNRECQAARPWRRPLTVPPTRFSKRVASSTIRLPYASWVKTRRTWLGMLRNNPPDEGCEYSSRRGPASRRTL